MPNALVVDDARVIRTLLSHHLHALGFEVVEAVNGQEALEKLNQAPSVNLALIDWNMPVVTGLDCLKAIRADSRFASLPVVMVTSETDMDHIVIALEAGATDYIMKPFTPEVISEKLLLLGLIDAERL